jgi:exonuclease SbcC
VALRRLRMSNFRRHRDTEIRFDDDAQVILYAGRNGAGKSTVLEAIMFALYGTGRRSTNLDEMISWGSEIEGMTVELDFELGGTEFQIRRMKMAGKSGASTAVLSHSGADDIEGPTAVTAAVTRILGMNAASYRLAVIAEQDDLDGLASLTPSVRARTLSRLLRLDAISRAREAARSSYKKEKDVVAAIGGVDDLEQLEQDLVAAQESATIAADEHTAAQQSIAEIDARLADSAEVEQRYTAALTAIARAEGSVASAEQELGRLTAESDALVVPEALPTPALSLEQLATAATDVEREIGEAKTAQQAAEQHRMLSTERDRVNARLAAVDQQLAEVGDVDGAAQAAAAAEQDRTRLQEQLTEVRSELTELTESFGSLNAEQRLLAVRLEKTQGLGATCETCEQEISEEHRNTQEQHLTQQEQDIAARRDEVKQQGTRAREAETRLVQELAGADEKARALAAAVVTSRALTQEREDLLRRRDTYVAHLGRLTVVVVDMDALLARKGEIAMQVKDAHAAAESVRVRAAALAQRIHLDEALHQARTRLAAAKQQRSDAQISITLQQEYDARRELITARDAEQQMLQHWEKQTAVTEQQVLAAAQAVTRAEKLLTRRRTHEESAQANANAARLLARIEEVLNTQLRPQLQGIVGQFVTTMTEGRYTAVKYDQDYNLSIFDEGKYRPVRVLSGGERNLISVAERLALGFVLGDRVGGTVVDYMILDEPFGSQDSGRRDAIVSVLRALRKTRYKQVHVISHVPGIEDVADVIYQVGTVEDEGTRTAKVAAA